MNEGNPSSKGPLIGTIIVLILLVLGALYFVGPANKVETPAPVATTTPAAVEEKEEDLSALESDFANLDVSAVSSDIASFEAEAAVEDETAE